MRRNYKPKVKLCTELLIESAINEVGKGATMPAKQKSTICQHPYLGGE